MTEVKFMQADIVGWLHHLIQSVQGLKHLSHIYKRFPTVIREKIVSPFKGFIASPELSVRKVKA